MHLLLVVVSLVAATVGDLLQHSLVAAKVHVFICKQRFESAADVHFPDKNRPENEFVVVV